MIQNWLGVRTRFWRRWSDLAEAQESHRVPQTTRLVPSLPDKAWHLSFSPWAYSGWVDSKMDFLRRLKAVVDTGACIRMKKSKELSRRETLTLHNMTSHSSSKPRILACHANCGSGRRIRSSAVPCKLLLVNASRLIICTTCLERKRDLHTELRLLIKKCPGGFEYIDRGSMRPPQMSVE